MATETTDLNRNHEDLSDLVSTLPVPDLALFDVARRNQVKATAVKHEWLELPLEVHTAVIGAANWDNSATTNLDVVSTASLKKYDVIQVGTEIVIISGITSSSKITVFARGHGSTSAASHSSGDIMYVIGSAAAQGNASGDTFQLIESEKYNYCQTMKEEIEVSMTQIASNAVGGNTLSKREAQAIQRIFTRLNRAMWFSVIDADTTNKIWTMKGFNELISSSTVNASSAAFTLAFFDSILKKTYDAGKPSNVAFFPAFSYAKLCQLLNDKMIYKTDEMTIGGRVNVYQSPYGDVEIRRDFHLGVISPSTVYVGNTDHIKLAVLRNLQSWENGRNGSKINKQFEMEATLQLEQEATNGKLYGLTTS